MSEIDYIVLDHDGGPMLEACIASIDRQTRPAARVIIVDNGSRTPVSVRLGRAANRIVDRSETNLGFAAGANRGMRHIAAEYVAFVNNDVVLASDWSASVGAALDGDFRSAAAQSVILRPDGRVDGAGIDISDGTYRQAGHGLPLGELTAEGAAGPGALGAASAVHGPGARPWGVSATAAIFRTAALRAVSQGDEVFDSRFFAYYEDVELSARLVAAGWRMALVPSPKATHAGSASAPLLGRRALALRTRNRHWVHRLHPSVGRLGPLLWEDAAALLRQMVAGHLADAATLFSGVVAGRLARLDRSRPAR
jgi:N-acetylglucosaminyl-diphospho-decaprenol L-rhamnosyltransferase